TFHAPAITALALVIYIAAWALMIGATEIALAIKMRREIKGEWFLILMGLASIIFAGLLFWNPLAGAAALIWIIAWYAVIMGVLAIIFGFRLRSLPTLATRWSDAKRLQSCHPKIPDRFACRGSGIVRFANFLCD